MKTRKMDLCEITKVIDPIIDMRNNNWFLISATDRNGKSNTLTAAWGGFGNVCERPTATVYIRPQRYTKKFVDDSGYFTMTFFDFEKYSKALSYLGSHSGANEPDKVEKAGLTYTKIENMPTFTEGKYVIICKSFFKQQMEEDAFIDTSIPDQVFPEKDFSVIYLGEIIEAYEIIK